MTDHDRDPVVARVLQELPVPDHGPGFWERLDARLDAEDARAPQADDPFRPGALPPEDVRVSTSELPALAVLRPSAAPPRRERVRFLAAAAVVAAVALATGVALRGDAGSDGQDPGTELADQPEAPEPAATEAPPQAFDAPAGDATPAMPTTVLASTAPLPSRPQQPVLSANDAVLVWIDALATGDLEAAESLLGPRTVNFIDRAGEMTMDEYLVASQEGHASWAGTATEFSSSVDIPGEGAVVLLFGTRAAEGLAEQRVEAFPAVQVEGGRWLVEPLGFSPITGGRAEVITPRPTPEGWSSAPPDVVLRATSEDPDVTYWFSLDGLPAVPDADGEWDPPGELTPTTHTLLVAVVGDDIFGAVAGTFVVEG